ncbi:rRNA maturation RNase YbeY [Microbacter margulisiae]|uniref:Endoribonuclease YbeY n=1 Tax=Microbacter margulisiae TaxID=1350067 RepID=A0A7W5GZX8_9PORP|nr:rRNA maturation RNase YbeY [Microbacter margulisiae]MBB3185943.1 rRNA maturation RNase YbeY [Microbacter margulisiae]
MIQYLSEDISSPVFLRRKVTAWIKRVAANHGKKIGDISYLFCNDEKIITINRQYLHHDYYTDIITFDSSDGQILNGDLFISLDTVASNAKEYNTPVQQELYRVMIHGILHLCGIDDQTDKDQELMTTEENKALQLIDF